MFSFLSQRILSIWMNLMPFMKSFPTTKTSRIAPKIITISPGGYRGYYLLGVTSYLKDNFDMDSYIFSGASAGAWFSLMMTYRGNHSELLENLNVFSPEFIQQDLRQIQHSVSKTLLTKYTTADFDLKRLAVGVSRVRPFYVESTVYTDFRDLKDAVECCQASSHIPFITGGMIRCYDRRLAFDGGFGMYPYLVPSSSSGWGGGGAVEKPVLHIATDIWKEDVEKNKKWNRGAPFLRNFRNVMEQTTVFSKYKYNMTKLYLDGYQDSARNHANLSALFPRKYSSHGSGKA